MAIARFEPYAGALRVWAADDAKYGDEYCWCGSIRWRSRDEIEIGPYDRKIGPNIWDAIVVACSEAGIKRVLARTYPGGASGPVRERWIDIEKQLGRIKRKAKGLTEENGSRNH